MNAVLHPYWFLCQHDLKSGHWRICEGTLTELYTLSEETAHPTEYFHLIALWAVLIQLNYWLRWRYMVEWAVSSESVAALLNLSKFLFLSAFQRNETCGKTVMKLRCLPASRDFVNDSVVGVIDIVANDSPVWWMITFNYWITTNKVFGWLNGICFYFSDMNKLNNRPV